MDVLSLFESVIGVLNFQWKMSWKAFTWWIWRRGIKIKTPLLLWCASKNQAVFKIFFKIIDMGSDSLRKLLIVTTHKRVTLFVVSLRILFVSVFTVTITIRHMTGWHDIHALLHGPLNPLFLYSCSIRSRNIIHIQRFCCAVLCARCWRVSWASARIS